MYVLPPLKKMSVMSVCLQLLVVFNTVSGHLSGGSRDVWIIGYIYTVLYTPVHQVLFTIQISRVSAFQGQVYITLVE